MCNSFKNGWIKSEKMYFEGLKSCVSVLTITTFDYDYIEFEIEVNNCCFGC